MFLLSRRQGKSSHPGVLQSWLWLPKAIPLQRTASANFQHKASAENDIELGQLMSRLHPCMSTCQLLVRPACVTTAGQGYHETPCWSTLP